MILDHRSASEVFLGVEPDAHSLADRGKVVARGDGPIPAGDQDIYEM
jgi:hypothetical protein